LLSTSFLEVKYLLPKTIYASADSIFNSSISIFIGRSGVKPNSPIFLFPSLKEIPRLKE
jgi:hypothetical protein